MRLIFSAIAFSPSFPLNLTIDPTDKTLSWESIPWVPEAFHGRFPVKSEKAFFFSRGFAARVFGLRLTKLLVAREKKPLVPRVGTPRQLQSNPVNTDTEGTKESVRINGLPVLGRS